MIFLAKCEVDNGATFKYYKGIVQASSVEKAKKFLTNHYAPGYDDICHVLEIKEYELHDGDIFELNDTMAEW